MPERPVLTNEEKILLNLKTLSSFADAFEAPARMTQGGMAQYLGAARPNITRSVKSLVRKGLVEERTSHVKGHRRRKKVYRLTARGLERAGGIEEGLRKTLRGAGYMDGGGVDDLTPVLDAYLGRAPPPARPSSTPGDVAWDDDGDVDRGPRFFGREREMKGARQWFKDPGSYFLVIGGMAGIGKTTLARALSSRSRRRELWHRFYEANTLEGLLHQLGLLLNEEGKRSLLTITSSGATGSRDLREFAGALANDLMGGDFLLVLDDYHLAHERVESFLRTLLGVLEEKGADGVKIMVTTRRRARFYDKRAVKVRGRVKEVVLEGLDPSSSRSLLEARGVEVDDFDAYYAVTSGHPLALELTETSRGMGEYADALDFVKDEIFKRLGEEERAVAEKASVHRYPLPTAWFATAGDCGVETLESLADKAVVQSAGEGYELHGLVKEYIYERLPPDTRRGHHRAAASFYAGRGEGYLDRLEEAHHLILADDPGAAASRLVDAGEAMIREGFFEILYILDRLKGCEDDLDPGLVPWMEYFRGALLLALGEAGQGRERLGSALEGADDLGGTERLRLELRVFDKLGEAASIQGDFAGSARHYEEAGKAYREIERRGGAEKGAAGGKGRTRGGKGRRGAMDGAVPEDSLVYANTLNGRALIAKRKGLGDEAGKLYNRAVEVLVGLDEPGLTAVVRFNIGRLLEDDGRLEEAAAQYHQALGLADVAGDEHVAVNVCNALGDMYGRLDMWKEAVVHFEKGLEYAVMTQDVLDTSRYYMEVARRYQETQLSRKVGARAREYFSSKRSDELRVVARMYDKISRVYHERRDWGRAVEFHQQAAELFHRRWDRRREAKARNNLGFVHRMRGEFEYAVREYNSALELLEKAKDRKAAEITRFNLGVLYEVMGEYEEARRWLGE